MLSLSLSLSAAALLAAPQPATAETVLGAFIFARHGDRTAKASPPTSLTDLGYREVFRTGSYYRSRYVADNASSQIQDLSSDIVNSQQLSASAPSDDVLQKSAMGFLQGLYPPAGSDAASMTLRDGTVVKAPLDGYQLIHIDEVPNGEDSEDVAWLESTGNCRNAKVSSNSYLSSQPFDDLRDSTADFYSSLSPMLEGAFSPDQIGYKEAYLIFDYLNVASIHNGSDHFKREDLFTNATYDRLLQLASVHQYNLAWNASDSIRASAGSTLANDTLSALSNIIDKHDSSTPKLNIQFGAYSTFLSFFGLADLPKASVNFTGIPDYASSMAFELVTDDDDSSSFPAPEDINVRFVFRNGTATADDPPTEFPLFDQSKSVLPWPEFRSHMEDISFRSLKDWCKACGSTDGPCASVDDASAKSGDGKGGGGGGGLSLAEAGVIGAFVTLGVIIIVQAAIFFLGGFSLVRKLTAADVQRQQEMEKGSATSPT